jgi:two-component system, LytTR family, sensor kinase
MQNFESSTYIYQRQRGHRWLRWFGILGVWAALGFIYAGPVYFEVRSEGMNHSPWRVLSWGVLTWCAWAPLTPVMIWLARRYSLEGRAWRRSLLVHVPAFVIISAAHNAAATLIVLSVKPFDDMGASPMAFWPRFFSRLKGAFGPDLLVYGGVLGVCYAIDYYRKYREREFQATQLETQLAQAQLHSLRMQLHPHFLFNTLNGAVGLVRDNQNQAAVRMLVGLSDLLRHALEHSEQQEVELRDELKFLGLYLSIQQMRFSDRLQVEVEIAPETMDALVPNLILQPLAENAINHGIAPRAACGLIGINAQTANGSLRLQVYDNGAGLPDNWQSNTGSGIGLANTIARLQQLYGDNQRFDIRNRKEGGVEVTISIPLRVRGAEETTS